MITCTNCGAQIPDNAKFCPDCGHQADSAPPEPAPDQAIGSVETDPNMGALADTHFADNELESLDPGDMVAGKFRIERAIGQGGMGRVYLATELIANGERERPVALKVISKKYVGSDKAVQRLLDEGLITQELSHRNIVKIYDIGVHGKQPYVAMEFIEGKPLHVWRGEKMANNESVPVRVAGQIIKEVLNGLDAAHEAGVIHRDLKPENIMLLDEPTETSARVKIVDFGVALATKSVESGTGTGLGTQLYMAPEQVRNANAANAAADLYSVSRIFYEMIVGVLPSGHWQPPSGGRSDVPPGIDALIEQGLAVNRDVRPQTAIAYRDTMIAAFNDPSGRMFNASTKRTPSHPIGSSAAPSPWDQMTDLMRKVPTWGWITIVSIILLLAIADAAMEETLSPQNCYYDAFGNWLCQ